MMDVKEGMGGHISGRLPGHSPCQRHVLVVIVWKIPSREALEKCGAVVVFMAALHYSPIKKWYIIPTGVRKSRKLCGY